MSVTETKNKVVYESPNAYTSLQVGKFHFWIKPD